jgi:hypothetical protein
VVAFPFGLSMAVDASNVYFTMQVTACQPDGGSDPNTAPGRVMKAPIGGGATQVVATGVMPLGVAVDATIRSVRPSSLGLSCSQTASD